MDKTQAENKMDARKPAARAKEPATGNAKRDGDQKDAPAPADTNALQAEVADLRARLAALESAPAGVRTGPSTAAATPPAAEAALSGADKERRADLAQSGYRLPAEWWRDQDAREKQEKDIARNMPSTDGSKPHKP